MSKYFIFIPNLLSIIRMGLVYPILNNILLSNFLISLGYFVIASLTDALDGFLARKMNWQTYLGTILDPVADKLLLSGTIFFLWINSYIPLYIFVIFIKYNFKPSSIAARVYCNIFFNIIKNIIQVDGIVY